VTAWAERPAEERSLLNPAFLALLLRDAAAGHLEEHGDGLPFVLAFLGLPLVLHARTRDILPTSVATSVPAFLVQHPETRVQVPPVAVQLAPSVREAIRFAVRHNALRLGSRGALTPEAARRAPRGMNTEDVRACRDRARFVGRWFGRAGDPVTVLTSWGLKL
jgi:hypothetical protein